MEAARRTAGEGDAGSGANSKEHVVAEVRQEEEYNDDGGHRVVHRKCLLLKGWSIKKP